MKSVTFESEGRVAAGVLDGATIGVVEEGETARDAVHRAVADGAIASWPGRASRSIPLAEVRLLAPIPEPRGVIWCVGKNYRAHAKEFHGSGFDSTGKEAVPEVPIVFTKPPTSVVGPGETIRASLDPTGTVDYEGELGVVIGRRAFGVPASEALDHVAGYVTMNDVTSRELQRRHGQWVIGKGLDSFCPMGPWLATPDEVGDLSALRLETHVNGELRQAASVADLIFDVPTLIETLSATMTLRPGDIIATGTPEGVGIGFDPPRYLAPGDVVSVAITGLGTLENPIG